MTTPTLTPAERETYARDGFLVRHDVLAPHELEHLRRTCEQLCERVLEHSLEQRKVAVSEFYVFEMDEPLNLLIKWEPDDPNVIQGLEPLVHLDADLERFGSHAPLADPVRELLGVDQISLYTEKLNVKRAGVGGAYALHRDLPYWLPDADDARHMITALIALDDASAENGALEVLPGSHLIEDVPYKHSELDFERNEIDPDRIDTAAMMPVELPAGSAVLFGPMLVHRSAPNRSGADRRALLYTYQPHGQRDQRDVNREWFAAHRQL